MKYYFFKLLPPRSTFMQDMTPAEMQLMQSHSTYWKNLGCAAAFGPVAAPGGGYGVAILELADDADPHALVANDPVVKANAGLKIEIYPMPRAIVRPKPAS